MLKSSYGSNYIPNLLTLSRLILTPCIIQAVIAGRHRLALVLFAIAALTDLLDGAAARWLGATSSTGAYFDPITDKVLLSGVYVALAVAGLMPWWLVGVILGRDAYILVAVGILLWLTPIRGFPPSVWGKISTFVQIVTATIWLARNVLEIRVLDALSSAMLWPCAAFTIWSGIHYTWRGMRLARAH